MTILDGLCRETGLLHTQFDVHLHMLALVSLALTLHLVTATSVGESCPDPASLSPNARRSRAAAWFAKAEDSAKTGDHLAAANAFSCSMQLVPHAFTAFNLGRSAEHIGDLEMAIAAYEQYLRLAPDAADRQEVTDKLTQLREKLDTLAPPPTSVIPTGPEPPPATLPSQPPVVSTAASAPVTHEGSRGWKMAGWISLGSAGVFLAGGTATNLLARRQMDRCNSLYDAGDRPGAENACASAKPLASTSYGLFAAGSAAALTGALLLWLPQSPAHHVSVVLPPGGFALQYQQRF